MPRTKPSTNRCQYLPHIVAAHLDACVSTRRALLMKGVRRPRRPRGRTRNLCSTAVPWVQFQWNRSPEASWLKPAEPKNAPWKPPPWRWPARSMSGLARSSYSFLVRGYTRTSPFAQFLWVAKKDTCMDVSKSFTNTTILYTHCFDDVGRNSLRGCFTERSRYIRTHPLASGASATHTQAQGCTTGDAASTTV